MNPDKMYGERGLTSTEIMLIITIITIIVVIAVTFAGVDIGSFFDGVAKDPAPAPEPATPAAAFDPNSLVVPIAVFSVLAALVVLGAGGFYAYRALRRGHVVRDVRRATEQAREERGKAEANEVLAAWSRVRERHEAISIAHAEHESDLLAVLDRPTLTDLHEPSTQRLYAALVGADDLRSETMPGESGRTAYAAAVAELDLAWRLAGQHADRVRLSGFAPGERKRLIQARALISKALDDAGSPAERQSCYTKATSLIEGLVPVPAPAAKALPSRVAAEITA